MPIIGIKINKLIYYQNWFELIANYKMFRSVSRFPTISRISGQLCRCSQKWFQRNFHSREVWKVFQIQSRSTQFCDWHPKQIASHYSIIKFKAILPIKRFNYFERPIRGSIRFFRSKIRFEIRFETLFWVQLSSGYVMSRLGWRLPTIETPLEYLTQCSERNVRSDKRKTIGKKQIIIIYFR